MGDGKWEKMGLEEEQHRVSEYLCQGTKFDHMERRGTWALESTNDTTHTINRLPDARECQKKRVQMFCSRRQVRLSA